MIGLVLVTHGRLADEFVRAWEHVVGPQDHVGTVAIGPDDDMEARRADIAAAIAQADTGRGVIVLTDLFGGTPSNLAISLMERGRIEVIAGINLPMLIRLESARKAMTVVAAVAAAREAGRKYISVASEVLGEAAGMSAEADAVSREVPITNRRGLHARASAKFVTLAATQPTEVQVAKVGASDGSVTGTSIMGLMMLGAAMGDTISISASGDGAEASVSALCALVEGKFGED